MPCRTRPAIANDCGVFHPYWITRTLLDAPEVVSLVRAFLCVNNCRFKAPLTVVHLATGRRFSDGHSDLVVAQFLAVSAICGFEFEIKTKNGSTLPTAGLLDFLRTTPDFREKLCQDIASGESYRRERERLAQQAAAYDALVTQDDPDLYAEES